ncbi:MAG: UDP-3-O-(3-hydroxymyristoyl)glucosamine N-acyltransferase [Caldimicrobium sp.]|jgi:UDP-3-O-[3-hydroxymyristoyl] glucosamine N-acyltransferase
MKAFKLSEIAEYVGGVLKGEDFYISRLNALLLAGEEDLTFIDSKKRLSEANQSKAKAFLAPLGFSEYLPEKSVIEVKDVRVALAKASSLFREEMAKPSGELQFTHIEPSAKIHKEAIIYPFVYIGKEVKIEKGVIVFPFCFIGDFCEIGEGTILFPHVVLYPGTILGRNCILHSGVILGADGFGYAQEVKDEGFRNLKIYHFGRVRIGDEVEIGANSTIDRATFGETVVGPGTKIDNLVQIGHNVRIGKECILVSHTAIGGSALVEDYVMLAGQVGVSPGSVIRKGAKVAAKSGVHGEIPPGEEVAGIPAIKASLWRRAVVIFEKLPEIYKEIKKLLQK